MIKKITLVLATMLSVVSIYSLEDNVDGTISDPAKKIIWQKCSVGQESVTTCENNTDGVRDEITRKANPRMKPEKLEKDIQKQIALHKYKATQLNWINAKNHCTTLDLAGKKWRLPTRVELNSLIDLKVGGFDAQIDTSMFPGTSAYRYWTNEQFSEKKPDIYWTIHFLNGEEKRSEKTEMGYVRCVSDAK